MRTSRTYYRCDTHPRYLGRRKPRISCPGCWWIWLIAMENLSAAFSMTRWRR